MIYHLPTINSNFDGYQQLALLDKTIKTLQQDKLELNFSNCGFFDANMAAVLGSVLTLATDRLNTIDIVEVPKGIESILRKNQFLTYYGYQYLEDQNSTTIPFERFRLQDSGRFSDYLLKYLIGKGIPSMSEGFGRRFKKNIFEIFQNAVMHSGSYVGIFICGQFYPNLQKIDLTIADAGNGIRETVSKKLNKKINSLRAIEWALQAGHSSKQGDQPGGMGLKLIKNFVLENKGKLQIVSRWGYYEFNPSGEQYLKFAADLPGTIINLEIRTEDKKKYRPDLEL